MNNTYRSNLKRIRDLLLSDTIEDDYVTGEDSDSDNDSDSVSIESDHTSTNEHISEESDISNSDDDDQCDAYTDDQPETLEKAGIIWSIHANPAQGRIPVANIIKTKPGPITKVQTILDAFKLFLTHEILDEVVIQTNRYAEHKSSKWKLIDRIELESFIGLVVRAGLHRNNHESLSDLWDISQSSPLYRATMSLQRFRQFLQFLRFDDRQNYDKTDRLSPIRYIFELFIKQLPRHFVPGENLTVDEQLVPFRGCCCFMQYMPNKPAKYGLMFWLLCDADSRYVLPIDLYTGKKDNIIQKNLVSNVVLHLVDQLPNDVKQGRTITFDRYFTDVKLSEALLNRKMTSIGVVDYRRVFFAE
ncbi:unnamed protein product [Rotaria sp. Silwood1]|nr:unnamed protein product [Rotaria sp. Silwood1]CAF4581322.1 unnamed protein product [Rotaria sp. Silwood1]